MITKEQFLILVLFIVCIFLGLIAMKKENDVIDRVLIKTRIDSIESENKLLLQDNENRLCENRNLLLKIDTLKQLNDSLFKVKRPIIKIINKYENYKSLNHHASADTMRSILSENNIN
jgi:thioredoxin-related protein